MSISATRRSLRTSVAPIASVGEVYALRALGGWVRCKQILSDFGEHLYSTLREGGITWRRLDGVDLKLLLKAASAIALECRARHGVGLLRRKATLASLLEVTGLLACLLIHP